MSQSYELDDVEVTQTTTLMDQIKNHVKKLRELKFQMDSLQEDFKQAEKAYLDYSRKVLPDMFKLNGLDSLSLGDGTKITVVTKTQCSINKNEKDRDNVARWLEEHGASDLVKSECIVPPSQVDKLKESNIIFDEKMSLNTNSVKAFILGQLGQKGSPATITVEDLPKGLNFFQFDEMEITQ